MTFFAATLWTDDGWLAEAQHWIDATLAEQGRERTGAITQPHLRPWSTVLRVPTADGALFFKAAAPVFAHEPLLTQTLADWRGPEIPAVAAIDQARGWMLLGDCGQPLRSLIQADRDRRHWLAVLPRYARLQRDATTIVPRLLATGILDRRLARLPGQYAALLAQPAALLIDQPQGMTSAQHAQLLALGPTVANMGRELAACGIAETLHHDDFHDGNIFHCDGQIIFADWAESCVAHPFFSLVVALRSAAYQLGLAADAAELDELRAAYLAEWRDEASQPQLEAAFRLAQGLGMICRSLTWHLVVASLEPALRPEHAESVPGWLLEFLAWAEREGLTGH